MRLIDADAIKIPNTHADIFENCRNCKLLDAEQVKELIDSAPTIDAVPVIRCKDCKHRYIKNDAWTCPFGLPSGPDGYCSYGERKEE